MDNLAIYGGTFDPIHNGHIETALAIQNYFHFQKILFLPCKDPVIKAPSSASASHRVAMLELALDTQKGFSIDLREIKRSTPSYMIETLISLRKDYPQVALSLILGFDAFLTLPQWYQWKKLISYTNILVIDRADVAQNIQSASLKHFFNKYLTTNTSDILKTKYGKIVCFDAGNISLSSTWIRQSFKQGIKNTYGIPDKVYNYIKEHQLYQ